jgi:hypothetical protein
VGKGINVPERKVFKDYEESNVRAAFERGTLSSWQDLVNLLERQSLDDWPLTPGESAHMIADARQAMKDNVPFSYHPETAFRVMRSHRNPELVRLEEQRWMQRSSRADQSISGEYHHVP